MLHSPLLVPVLVWLLLLAGLVHSEIIRAVLGVGCTALMVYQWLIYRKTNRGPQLLFLSLVTAGLGLSSVWLGLNVLRFYTYDPESHQLWAWHVLMIRVQANIQWAGAALAVIVFLGCWFGSRDWSGLDWRNIAISLIYFGLLLLRLRHVRGRQSWKLLSQFSRTQRSSHDR